MKNVKLIAIGSLLLFSMGAFNRAAAQSLGDAARAARKNKPETTATRHFDNDNLPTSDGLSVVGPAPQATPEAKSDEAPKPAADASAAAADRQKKMDEWKEKIDKQQAKIATLNHELDLDQREMRLRAAALYADPTVKSRNLQWDKEDAQYQNDLESKQKAIAEATQQLDQIKDDARKAGVEEQPKDSQSADKDATNKDVKDQK